MDYAHVVGGDVANKHASTIDYSDATNALLDDLLECLDHFRKLVHLLHEAVLDTTLCDEVRHENAKNAL